MPKHDTFNIEYQYQLLLKRMNLQEDRMHPQQKIQLKQTFYAAFGQLLILLRQDVSALPEEDGIHALNNMLAQVGDFFLAESDREN